MKGYVLYRSAFIDPMKRTRDNVLPNDTEGATKSSEAGSQTVAASTPITGHIADPTGNAIQTGEGRSLSPLKKPLLHVEAIYGIGYLVRDYEEALGLASYLNMEDYGGSIKPADRWAAYDIYSKQIEDQMIEEDVGVISSGAVLIKSTVHKVRSHGSHSQYGTSYDRSLEPQSKYAQEAITDPCYHTEKMGPVMAIYEYNFGARIPITESPDSMKENDTAEAPAALCIAPSILPAEQHYDNFGLDPEVTSFLKDNQLVNFTEKFKSERITFKQLSLLEREDLEILGFGVGEIRLFINGVNKLK